MNIREINPSTNRPEYLRNGGVADPTESGAGRSRSNSPEVGQDRVEISEAARAAARSRGVQDVSFARKALDSVPPLSPQQIEGIQQRIKDGYYTSPEVIDRIATGVVADLKGRVE